MNPRAHWNLPFIFLGLLLALPTNAEEGRSQDDAATRIREALSEKVEIVPRLPFVTGTLARVDILSAGVKLQSVSALLDDKQAILSSAPEAHNFNKSLFFPISVDREAEKAYLNISIVDAEGRLHTLRRFIPLTTGDYEVRKINVPRRYIKPPKKHRLRIQSERKSIASVFANPDIALASGFLSQSNRTLAWPVPHKITSRFGLLRLYNKASDAKRHKGTDLDGRIGDPIRASARGKVVLVEKRYYSGDTVVIDHGQRMFSLYFHLSKFNVKEGETVEPGQRIGSVGRTGRVTGPHLHFSIKVDGLYINPEHALTLDFLPPAKAP